VERIVEMCDSRGFSLVGSASLGGARWIGFACFGCFLTTLPGRETYHSSIGRTSLAFNLILHGGVSTG
jgi:hypothetical protein